MRTGILSFLSISYVDVENNDQDSLGTIGKCIYLYARYTYIYILCEFVYYY